MVVVTIRAHLDRDVSVLPWVTRKLHQALAPARPGHVHAAAHFVLTKEQLTLIIHVIQCIFKRVALFFERKHVSQMSVHASREAGNLLPFDRKVLYS